VVARVRRALTNSPADRRFHAELLLADGRIEAASGEFDALAGATESGEWAIRQRASLAFRNGHVATVDALVHAHEDRPENERVVTELIAKLVECRSFLRAHGASIEDDWRAVFLAAVGRHRAHGSPRYQAQSGVILHILNSLAPGGTERQCATLAAHQAQRPDKRRAVWVVRTDPRSGGRAAFFLQMLHAAGVHTTTLSDFSGRAAIIQSELEMLAEPPEVLRSLVNTREISAIIAAIEAIRPEVVQAWTPQCSAHAAIAGLLAGVPKTVLRGGSVAPDTRVFATEVEAGRQKWLRDAIAFAMADPSLTLINNCRNNLNDWLRWLELDSERLPGRTAVVPICSTPRRLPIRIRSVFQPCATVLASRPGPK